MSGCSLSTQRGPQRPSESKTSRNLSVQVPSILDSLTGPGSTVQKQGNQESPQHEVPSSSVSTMLPREREEMIILGIQVVDLTLDIQEADALLGLMRIPAGYYATVRHSGCQWRTKNKPLHKGAVEWDEPIPIPSDLSAIISLKIYVAFEIQPTLGDGERLRKFTITLAQLLDHTEKDIPYTLYSSGGDAITSPCSSLSVIVTQRKLQSSDSSASRALEPHRSPPRHRSELEDATNQGHSALSHYRQHRKKEDLERSIEHFERALDICPLDDPRRTVAISNMATAKFLLRRVDDVCHPLSVPLTLYLDVLSARPAGHPDRLRTLIQMAIIYFERFKELQHEVDITQARAHLREALRLSSEKSRENEVARYLLQVHADRNEDRNHAGSNSSMEQHFAPREREKESYDLSSVLLCRFQESGDLADLQHAITHLETLVRSVQVWDWYYLGRLANLGMALQDAVDLCPEWDPDKPGYLSNLANNLRARFLRFGELKDLESAISRFKSVVDRFPEYVQDNPECLNTLAVCLRARFHRLKEADDLEQAISRQKDALGLTPQGRPFRPGYLNNLASSFKDRFEHCGELNDLGFAISIYGDAVNLTPEGDPEKASYLHNLATALGARFERLGELGDLEAAILGYRNALDLTPEGHFTRSSRLHHLVLSLRARFKRLGNPSDLEESVSKSREVVSLTPEGHPEKPGRLLSLSASLLTRFKIHARESDLKQAISFSSHAACARVGPVAVRFTASKTWILCARLLSHRSLLNAYSVAVGLLPQFAWIGLSMTRRYQELIRGAYMVREATAEAVELGHLETAVEWLEQGRCIVWGELLQLRNSYDELSSTHPEHARRLRELSVELENAGTTREQFSSLSSKWTQGADSLEKIVDKHRWLAIKRDELLREIRAIPGLERFLLHKDFSEIRAAAKSGPVVILNAAKSRCDALIVVAELDQVVHVPLPNFTLARTKGLQNAVKSLLGPTRAVRCDERLGQRATRGRGSWESLLSVLWSGVVQPVLTALAISIPGDLSRLFWCPTGPFAFLPIHAAGQYGIQYLEPGHKVFDFVVSSYIPILSILGSSPTSTAPSNSDIRLLVVRQPPSDGQLALPGVIAELAHIETVIQNAPSAHTTLITPPAGTVEEVLSLMKNTTWVHFACHGIQDNIDPTQSGLCLADGRRLRLADMIVLSRPRDGLAFLSACQTAMGDEKLSDEAVHIAAGMLFAGYAGVVGTMWSISDRLAPGVARDVYEQLLSGANSETRRPDHREAARALHNAIGRLRERDEAAFEEWIPFIRVGH